MIQTEVLWKKVRATALPEEPEEPQNLRTILKKGTVIK